MIAALAVIWPRIHTACKTGPRLGLPLEGRIGVLLLRILQGRLSPLACSLAIAGVVVTIASLAHLSLAGSAREGGGVLLADMSARMGLRNPANPNPKRKLASFVA